MMKDGKRTRTVYGALHAFMPGMPALGKDLLFEPSALDFEGHVFNTEAHPFRVREFGSSGVW